MIRYARTLTRNKRAGRVRPSSPSLCFQCVAETGGSWTRNRKTRKNDGSLLVKGQCAQLPPSFPSEGGGLEGGFGGMKNPCLVWMWWCNTAVGSWKFTRLAS